MSFIIQKARALWNKDAIKAEVMLSMTLQIVLIFFAPLRKRSRDKRLHLLLWLAYLGADYVATLALGSILGNTLDNSGAHLPGQSLTAFWAPFLLLHLGGPDNITSYSIEDNELWLRHLLSFVVQVSTALLVLVLSAVQTTRLLVPGVLIFLAGAIKFGERTLALRAATMQRIKQSTWPGNVEILSEIDESELPYGDERSIIYGYVTFEILKPHIVNYPSDILGYELDADFVVMRVNRDFKSIGVELSYLYDILHTKVPTFIHHISFWVIRTASLLSIVTALILFHIGEKHDHEVSDLMVTYILLSVALFLETYSAINLVASKWMVISLMSDRWYEKIARFIYRAKNRIFCRGSKERWSGCIGQYCLIQSVMSKRQGSNWLKKTWNFLLRGEERAEVSDILEKTVINHIKGLIETEKSYEEFVDLSRKIRSSWISDTLDRYGLTTIIQDAMENKAFEDWVIAWHLATDMFYFALNDAPAGDGEEGPMREAMCKVSNYMMYLIMQRSSMMPPGFAEVTTVRTVQILKNSNIFGSDSRQARISLYDAILEESDFYWLCILAHDTALPLFMSIVKHLKQIAEEKSEKQVWEMVRDGWMEMLTYAAVNCSRTEHFKSLSRGGELLTHYWLLLAHYGFMEENNARLGGLFATTPSRNSFQEDHDMHQLNEIAVEENGLVKTKEKKKNVNGRKGSTENINCALSADGARGVKETA